MHSFRKLIKSLLPFSWRDLALTLFCLGLAAVFCGLLRYVSTTDFHVPLIFELAVVVVSLYTEGYGYGMLASIIGVIGVNFAFTYPYYKLDFSLTGYPLTFLCMLAVSTISCAVASRARESDRLRLKAEREVMRSNLLRAISHDFRTPLTSIIGSVTTVRSGCSGLTEQEKDRMLMDAQSEAEWLINMVENLLSITRIGDDSGPQLHTEPQVVEEVVYEAVSRFRRQYPEFLVSISIPDDLLFVDMDAVLIEQVLLNLLINSAIHGEGASGAWVSVHTEGRTAVFRVEDNGSGFTREQLAHQFDNYGIARRTHGSDAQKTMGIGLTVCSTIIKAHQGSMEASNSVRGACVEFRLPLSDAPLTLDDEN